MPRTSPTGREEISICAIIRRSPLHLSSAVVRGGTDEDQAAPYIPAPQPPHRLAGVQASAQRVEGGVWQTSARRLQEDQSCL